MLTQVTKMSSLLKRSPQRSARVAERDLADYIQQQAAKLAPVSTSTPAPTTSKDFSGGLLNASPTQPHPVGPNNQTTAPPPGSVSTPPPVAPPAPVTPNVPSPPPAAAPTTTPVNETLPTDPQYEQALSELMGAYQQDRADMLRQLGFTDPEGNVLPGLLETQYDRDRREVETMLKNAVREVDEGAVRSGTVFSGKRAKRQQRTREPFTTSLTTLASQLGISKAEVENALTNLEMDLGLGKNRLLMELADRERERIKNQPTPPEKETPTGKFSWFGKDWGKKDFAAFKAEARKRGKDWETILSNNPKLATHFGWTKPPKSEKPKDNKGKGTKGKKMRGRKGKDIRSKKGGK